MSEETPGIAFPAAPLWAFLIIILDVMIIYGLTAGWNENWD